MNFTQSYYHILEFLRKVDELNTTAGKALRRVKVRIEGTRIDVWCCDELLAHRIYSITTNLRGNNYKIQIAVGGKPDVPDRVYQEHLL
ncbi:MAG: hypothetical protein HC769_23730 [Cyanobacteria bacterium CRU_2_1]|nr:hypothetical protein [Cyanobacteria bacterium RU_5_0]NJR61579.1 hypothetical protein [Cyanobacteria bacterium CRU_2_1]